jgi:hypothetical protein
MCAVRRPELGQNYGDAYVTSRSILCHARVMAKPKVFCGMSRCPVVFSLSPCDADPLQFYKEKVRTSGHDRQINHIAPDTDVTCPGH